MGEQQRLVERGPATTNAGAARDARQGRKPLKQFASECQRYECGACFGDPNAELIGQAVAEIGRAHLGN